MNRILVKKDTNYTVINNTIFKDSRINMKTRGLFATIMSLPPEWELTIEGLSKIMPDGKDAISTAIKALIKFGYCDRKRCTNEKGRFVGYDYTFIEKPFSENPITEKSFSENPTQLNTNKLNTNKLSKESSHDFLNSSNPELKPVEENSNTSQSQQPKKISPSYERKGTTSKIDYSQLQNNFTFRDKNIPHKELITFLCMNNKELVKMGGMYSKVDKKGKIKFLERFASINATKKAWKNENDCLEHFINYCNQNK